MELAALALDECKYRLGHELLSEMEECQEYKQERTSTGAQKILSLASWITRYYMVAEVRNEGRALPPEAYMLVKNPNALMLEMCFQEICGTCDTVCREFCSKRIGVEVFDAPVITPDEEDKQWLSSVLSITTTISLAESGAHQPAECTLSISQPSEHHLLGLQILFGHQILQGLKSESVSVISPAS